VVARVNRHEMTDGQWEVIAPLLPRLKHMGRPPRDAREMLDAMLWLLRTGAPWRDLPDWYGPWQTVYTRFCQWRDSGVLDRMVEKLQVLLGDAGKIDWELWCIDGSSIRAARCAAGAGKRGARKSPRITR
jgi:transposase